MNFVEFKKFTKKLEENQCYYLPDEVLYIHTISFVGNVGSRKTKKRSM